MLPLMSACKCELAPIREHAQVDEFDARTRVQELQNAVDLLRHRLEAIEKKVAQRMHEPFLVNVGGVSLLYC